MKIIFAMAGASSRFTHAGYKVPKYMLPLQNKSVFFHAVSGFVRYFNMYEFIFVYRDLCGTKDFIYAECKKLGLEDFCAVELQSLTQGQAQSVYEALCALKISDNENMLIFNIDTFRVDFVLPDCFDLEQIDGYLEVFRGDGEQWSFVLPKISHKVAQTAEKSRISPFCSSGLYYFRCVADFKAVFESMLKKCATTKGEYYIAPMYNALIAQGKDIRYYEINPKQIIFCGTPQEYENLKSKEIK